MRIVEQGLFHGGLREQADVLMVFARAGTTCKGAGAHDCPRPDGRLPDYGKVLLSPPGIFRSEGFGLMPAGESLAVSPFDQFQIWMSEAEKSEPSDPNAMIVATTTLDGYPSLRTILLKGVDERGFVFYTNKESRKGAELAANPNVALLFHWKSLRRQIRIEGTVEDVTDAEADAYFASRPRISRLGAWASQQSRLLENRTVLEKRLAETERGFPNGIPRPGYWSGYRVLPERFEFWQDMPYRLHDRTVYRRSTDGVWGQTKLYP
jgi:pyridoxamine 5'-phosphate oxidase